MSTPFSLRRDTAANIATRAGAVGEVVIDTTNQRATVHDGSTLGGFAVAAVTDLPGRNVVINGNFAINQRAYASGGSLAAGAYAHDRWRDVTGSSGTSYSFTQATPDTTITIAAGTLGQVIDAPNVYSASWWLTWVGTAKPYVAQGGNVYANSTTSYSSVKVGGITVNALFVSGLSVGTSTVVGFSSGTLGLAQFEAALPNAGPSRFERRHGEMALCQRYYEVVGVGTVGIAITAAIVTVGYRWVVSKRAAPTYALLTTSIAVVQPGVQNTSTTSASLSVQVTGDTSGVNLNISGFSGLTVNAATLVNTASIISVSAEL